MTKNQHENYKNAINKAACDYYKLSQQGADITNAKHKLVGNILEYLMGRHKYCNSFNVDSDLSILDFEVLMNFIRHKIEKWAPGEADFFPYFVHFFYLRIKSELKAKNHKDSIIESYSDTVFSNDSGDKSGEEYNEYMEDLSPEAQTVSTYEYHNDLTILFTVLNQAMLMKKKEYENSPKFCYPVRFYTELTTMTVSELGKEKSKDDIPAATLDVIDKDFAAFYLDAEALNSFADIFRAELRPLSDFTFSEADSGEKCGYALKAAVYKKYVAEVKGKDVSDSAVSQQKKQFEQLLGLIRKEHLSV